MWGEIGKALLTGVVTLAVTLVGLRMQEGSRSRRLHRALIEDLDVLEKAKDLHDQHETELTENNNDLEVIQRMRYDHFRVRARLQGRIDELLEAYIPTEEQAAFEKRARRFRRELWQSRALLVAVIAPLTALLVPVE